MTKHPTAHCKMHAAYCKLYTTNLTHQTAHYTLHTSHCALNIVLGYTSLEWDVVMGACHYGGQLCSPDEKLSSYGRV